MEWKRLCGTRTILKYVNLLSGSAILAFGLYHVHSFSGVTEGGVLGLTLLLHHWFRISPAVSGFILNFICYILGMKVLGKKFIAYSIISGSAFSIFYAIIEQFDPLWPNLVDYPLLAAVVGAMFVGVGVGLCVRAGGAPGGDDALAMSLAKITKKEIQWVYLVSDLIVLMLSLSYIPVQRLIYSLLTVVLSGQIIGIMQKMKVKRIL
ncbi:YitT family protein [uncultured Eubacterium sp.]|uniref:YitT family protein n=1 Tax=uncultured Eubacterium sp. TaxID=165185 RepID=UPI00267255F5|nr:YitT family protein [uncultured Eubacterium sp.]